MRVIDGVEIVESNRFSEFVDPKDRQGLADLISWRDWFRKDAIKATITLTDKGYALYREGMEEFLYE